MVEPSVDDDRRLVLPPSLFGIAVLLVISPRRPKEDEECLLYNQGYALMIANSIVLIPKRQYIMSGGMDRTMNDLSIIAIQVVFEILLL